MTARTILLVDDDRIIHLVLKAQFERDGYEVVQARTVREALRRLSEEIAVALVDVRLPDGDGFDLARDIRDRNPDCAVINMSSQDFPDGAERARASGAYAYLPKPFRYDRLLDLLADAARDEEDASGGR